MVVATAVLIAAMAQPEHRRGAAATPTHAEVVMQGAMQKALASPKAAVVAENELHERRGF
jgi:hypothetical protein